MVNTSVREALWWFVVLVAGIAAGLSALDPGGRPLPTDPAATYWLYSVAQSELASVVGLLGLCSSAVLWTVCVPLPGVQWARLMGTLLCQAAVWMATEYYKPLVEQDRNLALVLDAQYAFYAVFVLFLVCVSLRGIARFAKKKYAEIA